jgi:hypothetical protein
VRLSIARTPTKDMLIDRKYLHYCQAVDRYNGDEGNAMWAVQHLIDFLWKMLTEYELEKVHIIGHR